MLMLRRVIDALVMPLGIAWMLALAALLLFVLAKRSSRQRGYKASFLMAIAALIVFYFGSIQPTGNVLLAWLERPFPVQPASAIERVDAVMVLGGAPAITQRLDGTMLLDPGRRFEAAMSLIEADRARLLVLSGTNSGMPGDSRSEADHLRAEAERRGVDPARILSTPVVATTGEEMRALAAMAQANGWTRVAITTESWHLRRAMALARRSGLQPIPFSSGVAPRQPKQPWVVDWIPSLDGVWRTTRAWHELLGHFAN